MSAGEQVALNQPLCLVETAKAEVEASEAFVRRTESDLDRLEQAVKTNAVSQQEVTRATAERDQARAGLLAAKAKLDPAGMFRNAYTDRVLGA